MSPLWGRDPEVVAICCSDLHLGDKKPVARAAEPDWYAAQERPLRQLRTLQVEHDAPVLLAGDLFHRWNEPVQTANFVLDHFPRGKVYAVPGQHDMPYHSYADLHRSAYGTIQRAGLLESLEPGEPVMIRGKQVPLCLHGFPFGYRPEPCRPQDLGLDVAVIHDYVWIPGKNHPGPPRDKRAGSYAPALAGYHASVFGDNHMGFITSTPAGGKLVNCGAFQCRRLDERHYTPFVVLLFSDGTTRKHPLDVSADLWTDPTADPAVLSEALREPGFVEELTRAADLSLNFGDVVRRFLTDRGESLPPRVRKLLLSSIGEGD